MRIRRTARQLVSALSLRAVAGLVLLVLSVGVAGWITDTDPPNLSEARGVGLYIPGLQLPPARGYRANISTYVDEDQVGHWWTPWSTCRNPVSVFGYFELEPAVWRTHKAFLSRRVIELQVVVYSPNVRNFRFNDITDPERAGPTTRPFIEDEVTNRHLPLTRLDAHVFRGWIVDWAKEKRRITFGFEADLLSGRGPMSCYLGLPALIGQLSIVPDVHAPGVGWASGAASNVIAEAAIDRGETYPPSVQQALPSWFCWAYLDGLRGRPDCSATVVLQGSRGSDFPSFVLFILGVFVGFGVELFIRGIRRGGSQSG